ncbi:unnamed protein product [Ceratitis capitata]|uniref:(Mediterranean fruit fly) hypothetical protein n=1 Tax=Ceratitis capitata TaxID=7213 RepID=A0A811UTH0_CERCA|nr:unnamed protein product [Ceratitis capitata]
MLLNNTFSITNSMQEKFEAKVDLARGAPVFGEKKWKKFDDKLNPNIPQQRSVVEWKKWTDTWNSHTPNTTNNGNIITHNNTASIEPITININETSPLLTETSIVHSTPIINTPPRPLLQNRRKRSFQDAIAKLAKEQAEANKIRKKFTRNDCNFIKTGQDTLSMHRGLRDHK